MHANCQVFLWRVCGCSCVRCDVNGLVKGLALVSGSCHTSVVQDSCVVQDRSRSGAPDLACAVMSQRGA